MTGRVTVVDHIYERQGVKWILMPDGKTRMLQPGPLPEPSDDVLAVDGEPAFRIELAEPVHDDADVPDAVGLALRRAAERFDQVMPDGRDVSEVDEVLDWTMEPPVEWVTGPLIDQGGVMIFPDTDDVGYTRAMIDAMVAILVAELEPLDVVAHITTGPRSTGDMASDWRSSEERATT